MILVSVEITSTPRSPIVALHTKKSDLVISVKHKKNKKNYT